MNGAHRVKNDATYDLRAEICDFLANNEGKSWTKDLKDKIDKLINDFNKANKSEARRELIEDDQGNLLERNTYDKLGKLTIAQKRTYYENGQVRIVESDGDGNILLDELYTKDSVFIKNNMEK